MSRLIEYLMRGGSYGYYWTKQSSKTYWWATDFRLQPPDTLEDVYFSVHPSIRIKGPNKRATKEEIEAINCVYADFDLKDFENSKGLIAEHIKRLKPPPSVVIDSGGGYHCYWLLEEPFVLSTELKMEIASDIQKNWVVYVGGDLAVHDLARVMRVPGTYNYKYGNPKPVQVMHESYSKTYTLAGLQECLPQTDRHRGEKTYTVPKPVQPNDLSFQEIVDLASKAKGGKQFVQLFKGSDLDYPSPSEADLALCAYLAFWTGGDYEKMNQLFRLSDRLRPKWEREDYRHETLTKAILGADDFYIDPTGLLTAGAHDEGNASCTFGRVKGRILFCEALDWLQYKDGYWERELAERVVEEEIVQTLKARRNAAVDAENEEILRASKPTAPNVMRTKSLLKRKVAVPISKFDVSKDELNCPNGVLNLRTGKLAPHHPKKLFTYCVPTRYDPEASQGFWKQWLVHTVGGSQELADYLQLAIGYSLTGRVREEVMFYVYGPPRAGKGVFTETLIAMLGGRPLATEVDVDMFMAGKGTSSSVGFSLAPLKAARFVAASESKEDEWLNAKYVKRWTGRNYITCAFKHGNDFTYQPQFKIWITSNFPPQMDADDKAAWGRLRILQFPISHLGKEDKSLKSKMLETRVQEGILAWAVEGAMKWYANENIGLITPDVVTEEVNKAQASVDWVASWIEEEVRITGRDSDRLPTDLYYPEYKDWCHDNGVSPKSLRSLNRTLRKKGYTVGVPKKVDGKTKRCWVGALIRGYRASLKRLGG